MEPPLLSPKSFVRFLRQHPLIWISVALVVLGSLLWIASNASAVPESPFQYRL